VAVPVCRLADDVGLGWGTGAYTLWGVAFGVVFTMKLLHEKEWFRRKLLASLVVISGFHLLDVLAQDLSTVDGITIWGPLALTISMYLMPVMLAARIEPESRMEVV